MRAFISYIVKFTLGLLVLNFIIYALIYQLYYRDYETFYMPKGSTTFLLADSHGKSIGDHLAPLNISNFSADSDSYLDMERKLKYLIRNYDITKILITVDRHTLSSYRNNANNLDRSIYFVNNVEEDPIVHSKALLFNKKYLTKYFIPLNGKGNSVVRAYISSFFTKKRSKRNSKKKPINDLKIEQRVERQFGHEKSVDLQEALQRIIDLCKSNEIELVGVRFPLAKDYLSLVKDIDYGASQILISNGYSVLNFEDSFVEHDEYFKNQDHVNSRGAAAFEKVMRASKSKSKP